MRIGMKHNGRIDKIDNLKRGNGAEYKRVYFTMENGDWAKTDLCPTYRNFPKWRPYLREGINLAGLVLRDKITVDADFSTPQPVAR